MRVTITNAESTLHGTGWCVNSLLVRLPGRAL